MVRPLNIIFGITIMYNRKWSNLKKCNAYYTLQPTIDLNKTKCQARINFTHIAFDWNEEYLSAVDTKGDLYCIELSDDCPSYVNLGNVGRCTFLAFNPIDKTEILAGLATGDIKILKLGLNLARFCLLSGHKIPPTHISFYKNYCLTSSCKEVIMWYLQSCNKAHQLRVNTQNVIVKKASFSSLGHIVVLYHNDTLQTWMLNELDSDTKIDGKAFGMRSIKDFVFTGNGRAMIIASSKNKIIVLNTCNWNLLKAIVLPENGTGIKQLCIVPLTLDGGANSLVAVITSKCTLHLLNLNLSCFVDTVQAINNVKKVAVSAGGRFLAYIGIESEFKLIFAHRLFPEKCFYVQKGKESCRPQAHKIDSHLQCVRQTMKEELRLKRLLPILHECGEYPERYRTLIWSTILKLPANKHAYTLLANKTIEETFTLELLKKYPLVDRSKMALMGTTIKCLTQWCTPLIQSPFIPKLIFPFLVVFQKDHLLAFELIVTILLNYCQKWFEYHPLPPLNILGIIENVLLEADPLLLNTFCEYGITSSEYAWPLLQTAMSEVLSRLEWLILWDYLISLQKPSLFLMCVVAYNICLREIIISQLHSMNGIKGFYNAQNHVSAKDILRVAQKLETETPYRIHPACYLTNKIVRLPLNGPYPPYIVQEFPKLISENTYVSHLEKLKKEEQIMYERNKSLRAAEEKRLQQETEAFVEHVRQEKRNEIQKCLQEYVTNMDHNLKCTDKSELKQLHRICMHEEHHNIPPLEIVSESEDSESHSYDKFKEEIDKLEYEVETFLHVLNSKRSQVNVA
ncbi:hypothetical protein KM043_012260 [Ampulex compressa]|nr:hypothetical protein KM043_012260 [Ampulex compressa]